MRYIGKHSQVNKFQVYKDTLYLLDNSILKIIDKKGLHQIDFNSSTLYLYDNKIYSGKNFYYAPDNKKIKIIDDLTGYYYTDTYFEDKLLFSNTEMIVYSMNNKQIEFRIPFSEEYGLSMLYKDKFVARGDDYYAGYLLEDYEKPIWQHSFSDLLEGEEIKQHGEIIIHKGILYIYLADKRNNKNTATIAIDVETGEIKNKYKGFAGKLFLYKDKLYTAGYYKVQILDIETEQISEIDFTDILKPKDLQIHWNNFIVENDYIYFIDGHWATTNKMGILDLKNKQLVWETSIEINDGINNNIREIKISGNRLYAHCSDKSLHIFEKGEEIT
ncbi:hypothetical protein KRX57_08640 [Weeksellaceae bacterium TAE3-ERU29]|nr:hypothetical protein [Weeksellaceae bacterium TAE3-ERU29]